MENVPADKVKGVVCDVEYRKGCLTGDRVIPCGTRGLPWDGQAEIHFDSL